MDINGTAPSATLWINYWKYVVFIRYIQCSTNIYNVSIYYELGITLDGKDNSSEHNK